MFRKFLIIIFPLALCTMDGPSEFEDCLDYDFKDDDLNLAIAGLEGYAQGAAATEAAPDDIQQYEATNGKQCPECQQIFSRKRQVGDHCRAVHGYPSLPCGWEGCTNTYKSKQALENHQKECTYKYLKCPTCNKLFPKDQHFWHFLSCQGANSPEIWKCKYCLAVFHSQKDFKIHIQDEVGADLASGVDEEILSSMKRLELRK